VGKLLIDDKPVMVLPKLATEIGLNEAVVLQQIHYWLETYRDANKQDHFHNGKWWVYNTKQEWQKNFPWWSESTVWRALTKLRDNEILIATNKYNKKNYDKTLWYTINYKKLEDIEESLLSKWENGYTQNDKMDIPKMTKPIPEINAESNPHNNKLSFSGDLFDDCTMIYKTLKNKDFIPTHQFLDMIKLFEREGVIAEDYYKAIQDQDASGKYPNANNPTSYKNWTLTNADRRINPKKHSKYSKNKAESIEEQNNRLLRDAEVVDL
jgi:hypothetical protein